MHNLGGVPKDSDFFVIRFQDMVDRPASTPWMFPVGARHRLAVLPVFGIVTGQFPVQNSNDFFTPHNDIPWVKVVMGQNDLVVFQDICSDIAFPVDEGVRAIFLHRPHDPLIKLLLRLEWPIPFRAITEVLIVAHCAVDAPDKAALKLTKLGHVATKLRNDRPLLRYRVSSPCLVEINALDEVHDDDNMPCSLIMVRILNFLDVLARTNLIVSGSAMRTMLPALTTVLGSIMYTGANLCNLIPFLSCC